MLSRCRFAALLLCAIAFSAAIPLGASVLKPTAAAAFDLYVKLTEQRMDDEIAGGQIFLWIDGLTESRRAAVRRELHDGGLIVERLETRDGSKSIDAPGALIHHWVGLVFVPGVRLDDAVALMQDYDQHARIFSPNIAASKILERSGSHFRVALRFYVKKVIAVTVDTENEADFFHPAPDRAYSRIRSIRVAEVANAGKPDERQKAPGEERGFIYRLNTYWRFLERDGGTYIQCESLTLSRNVPFALAWIIKPLITEMPKDSLSFVLERAKAELLKRKASASL
jgi:hypothetical protein